MLTFRVMELLGLEKKTFKVKSNYQPSTTTFSTKPDTHVPYPDVF